MAEENDITQAQVAGEDAGVPEGQVVIYHPVQEFLNLSLEALFQEPVDVQFELKKLGLKEEDVQNGILVENLDTNVFLELSIDQLLNVPVRPVKEIELTRNEFNAAFTIESIPRNLKISDLGQRELGRFESTQVTLGVNENIPSQEFNFGSSFGLIGTFSFQQGGVITRLPSIGSDIVDPNDGELSLREAIIAANANAGNGVLDTILIRGGVFTLTSALDVTDNLVINGEIRGIFDAQNLDRLFNIYPGVTLTINNITLQNGKTSGNGGIFNVDQGTLVGDQLLIQNGIALGQGGGIYNHEGVITLNSSTIAYNEAAQGGGIANINALNVQIINSTFSTNTASQDNGGGIYNLDSAIALFNSTIAFNMAHFGGGIYNDGTSLSTLVSTLIASNSATMGGEDLFGNGFLSNGHNLIGDTSDSNYPLTNISDILNVGAAGADLLPLAFVRGDLVHDLGNNSLAINAGSNPLNLALDQTGLPREIDDPDIGAVEKVLFNDVVVTTHQDIIADDGLLSLREAILFANESPKFERITLGPGTYDLTISGSGENGAFTGDLDITDSVIIRGAGVNQTFISQSTLDRIFEIFGTNTRVELYDLTLTNGSADYGGGVYNEGQFLLIGGAMTNNMALIDGGAIYNASGGIVSVQNSNLLFNSAGSKGGAIYQAPNPGTSILDFLRMNMAFNSADQGGGMYVYGTAQMGASLLAFNQALTLGGGIVKDGAVGTEFNLGVNTISNNFSAGDGGGMAAINGGNINIGWSTITQNTALGDGGGLFVDSGSRMVLLSTIVAGNTGNEDLSGAPFFSAGFNYIGSTSGAIFFATPVDFINLGVGPLALGPLQNNGGFTFTHALGSTSLAIDHGDPNPPPEFNFDQRGQPTINVKDIGAYEFVPPPIQVTNTLDSAVIDGTLRKAILDANNIQGPQILQLSAGNFILNIAGSGENNGSTGDLDIADPLTIRGTVDPMTGQILTTITQTTLDRVFDIIGNVNVRFENVIISGGFTTIENGGGIRNEFGAFTGVNVIFDGNTAINGGGIYSGATADTSIFGTKSEIINNMAFGLGGGVYQAQRLADTLRDLFIATTDIAHNQALAGGGLYVGADATLNFNAIYDNQAVLAGGGIFVQGGLGIDDVFIQISTVSGNVVTNGDGGGIAVSGDGETWIRWSTITDNSDLGGGLGQADGIGSLALTYLVSSIVAGNQFNVDLAGGGFISLGYNLIGGNFSDFLAQVTDFVTGNAIAAALGPLADNGGSTPTHALGAGSLALDNGDPTQFAPDQRLFNITDGMRDIGAFELGGLPPIVLDLNHDGHIQLISPLQSPLLMDINLDGIAEHIGWVGPDDGILVYDQNHDGKATDLSEIMLQNYHSDAKTDAEGLSLAFDTNQDGIFNEKDDTFNDFGVWQDLNQNALADEGEFHSLSSLGIVSINLNYESNLQYDQGNVIHALGTYTDTQGQSHLWADVSLGVQDVVQGENTLETLLNQNLDTQPQSTIDTQQATAIPSDEYKAGEDTMVITITQPLPDTIDQPVDPV